MNEELYAEQIKIEEESRGLTIERYFRQIENSQDPTDNDVGLHLIKNLVKPLADAIDGFVKAEEATRATKFKRSAKLLMQLDAPIISFLFLKAVFGSRVLNVREDVGISSLATTIGNNISWEMSLQKFRKENKAWLEKIVRDFDKRDISQSERETLMKKVFAKHNIDVTMLNTSDKFHVGYALIDMFIESTGLLEIYKIYDGRKSNVFVGPTEALMNIISARTEAFAPLMSLYPPMVVKPRPWSAETLGEGGYITHNLTPYPLVKRSRRPYRNLLKTLAVDRHAKLTPILG